MSRYRFAPLLALALAACGASAESPDPGDPLEFPDGGVGPDAEPEQPVQDDIDQPMDCAPGFIEDGERCTVDPDARWDVVVLAATFDPLDPDGDNWDLNDGLPDGYVYIEFGSKPFEVETEKDNEKLNPSWNATLIWGLSAAELRSHFELSLYDYDAYDVTGDDLQASCSLTLPDEAFSRPEFDAHELDSACPSVRLALVLN